MGRDEVNLPSDFHDDPADHFIVAIARMRKLEVVTADRAILAYAKAKYVEAIDAMLKFDTIKTIAITHSNKPNRIAFANHGLASDSSRAIILLQN